MQSADLFCCSCNALLITRGDGCLIIAGGGLRIVNQRRDRYTNYSKEDVNKPQKKTFLLLPCCSLNDLFSFVCLFFIIQKESFSPPWKKIAIFSLLIPERKWKCHTAVKSLVFRLVYTRPFYAAQNWQQIWMFALQLLVFCLSNPPNQPSWQATVDLFHSPFPWQLSPRDRGGFTRRQSAAVESLFTAWLKCWYSLACVTASLCSSMSISASLRKYIISVSMVIPVIRLLVKPDSCVAVILSFFPADELRSRTHLPLMKSWPGFFGVYVFPG